MDEFKVVLMYVRSTKNMHLYGIDGNENVSSQYIRKSAFKGDPPKKIEVTIREYSDG